MSVCQIGDKQIKFQVNLELRQTWIIEIDAANRSEAEKIADELIIPADEPDYSYQEVIGIDRVA